jgi:hypothetical protein
MDFVVFDAIFDPRQCSQGENSKQDAEGLTRIADPFNSGCLLSMAVRSAFQNQFDFFVALSSRLGANNDNITH